MAIRIYTQEWLKKNVEKFVKTEQDVSQISHEN